MHDSVDDLKAGKSTELPANAVRYGFVPKAMIDHISQVAGLAMAEGWLDIKGEPLNARFPEIQAMSVETFFKRYATG